ncbi:putative sulfate exporter family transporter [Polaromonas sp. P1-6]|nr:putative sulfate exporter family transporter [Polaromonas sp. P1-6]UUZ70482.1 putative sulfate exporter family transporter [Polaromonas sp. P2-4]
MVCTVIALAATFLSEHYGGPQLLYALLIGLSLHFLSANPQIKSGINFCAKTVLRAGVALLGVRITLGQVAQLGVGAGIVVVVALALTVLFGVLLARWLKRPREEGLLSGGAVAICGASAAMAVSSVLPQTKENERFTLLAVVGVTVLSTVAMVIYPFLLKLAGFNATQSGIFLGGTIHDVAQVVAAGMMVGQDAGDAATVVKLFRVMLLMPVVLLIAFTYRKHPQAAGDGDKRAGLVPGFLLAFVALVLLASAGVFPPAVTQAASSVSRGFLVLSIAAAGVKTSFEDLMKLGWQPVVMLLVETVFIAGLVMVAIVAFGLGV